MPSEGCVEAHGYVSAAPSGPQRPTWANSPPSLGGIHCPIVIYLGYVRVSRVGDREETLVSPELQRQRIATFAESRRLDVEMLEPELDVSGGTVSRPILDRAIERIEAGEAKGLIVAQLDRLSRMSLVDALHIIRRIEQVGGEVLAAGEAFDTSTPEGRMGRNVFLSMGEMQLDRYKAQFAAAKVRAALAGIWPIARVPIGYRKNAERRLEPDPRWAPRVVQAFERRAAGAPWSAVAPILERGLSGIAKIIANRVYLGEINYAGIRNPSAHPALVGVGLFEAAQLGHPRPPRGRHGPALLGGLLRCAACRGTLTPDVSLYRCNGRRSQGRCPSPAIVAKSLIEPLVEHTVLTYLSNRSYIGHEASDALESARQTLAEADAELAAYQQVTSALEGSFGEGLRARVNAVEEARRAVASAQLASQPEIAGDVVALWPSLDVEERRHVLRGALGVVWVRKGRGAVAGRVKMSTVIPPGLPQAGRGSFAVEPIGWDDIEGTIEPRL